MTTFNPNPQYDIIFAGGGTAACVAAGRVAAADPSLSILIIERGKDTLDDPSIYTPGLYGANLLPTSQNVIFYQAEKEPSLNNRARIISTGGTLGGGSSTNAMMYTRAQGIDFDSFEVEGWDKDSLIKYAKKLEAVHVDEELIKDTKSVHGFSGPINISFGTHCPKGPQDDFLAAAESYGYSEIKDLQDFESMHGFTRSAKYIGLDGTRQSAALRYIKPLLADGKHPNLHILPETKVKRVLFKDKRAVGVEYEPEPMFLKEGAESTIKSVQASKLVVVSSGALGTPSILERSGIGKKELLESLDIPVVSDLPGVGENYQDHHFLLCSYKTNLSPDETLDALFTGQKDVPKALAEKDPYLGWNGVDIGGKLRMTDEEAAALGPEFKTVWDRDFANEPSKPVMLMGILSFFIGDPTTIDEDEKCGQYVTLGSYTPYPYSRGSIHVVSPDTNVPAKFITGFLADASGIDVKKSVWAYRKLRDLYRRTNAYAGEVSIRHPGFHEGSKAACTKAPLKEGGFSNIQERQQIEPIVYDEDDDRAIEQFVRDNVETTWHSLGTCKMAPREKSGVVDKNLNVYGTEGLKCADLSIIPENVAANTNNTALIVGEKAADIIGKELGLVV